jgi:hypothetical protein
MPVSKGENLWKDVIFVLFHILKNVHLMLIWIVNLFFGELHGIFPILIFVGLNTQESSIYVYLAFDRSKIFQYPTFLELVFSWTWKHEVKEMVVIWYVGVLLIVKPSSSLLEHMVKLFTCTWIKNSCNGCGNIILVLTKCGKSSTSLLNVFLTS